MGIPERESETQDWLVGLADLVRRSGRAAASSRSALCMKIKVDGSNLNFLTDTGDEDFALQLINHLYQSGDIDAILRLCDTIAGVLKGWPAKELNIIRAHLQPSTAVVPNSGQENLPATLQLIGWGGIEREQLYSMAQCPVKQPGCLVGMGTVETLPPRLTFRQNPFDVVVADIEYLDRYHRLGRLQYLTALSGLNLDALWAKLASPVRTAVEEIEAEEQIEQYKILGVPIQFGFMEVLVNTNLLNLPTNDEDITYAQLNIFSILEECKKRGAKVGFWDLYLPTLTHLVATVHPIDIPDASLIPKMSQQDKINRVRNRLRTITQSEIEEITRPIAAEYKGYIKFLKSAYEVTESLKDDRVAIVYGAGSSLIVPRDVPVPSNVRLLAPQNFLFIWMNCCAVLQGSSNTAGFPPLINHWLEEEQQHQLSFYEYYYGCPVTEQALKNIRKSLNHPACRTLEKVVNDNGALKPGYTLSIRVLPDDWRGWQKCWEDMRRQLVGYESWL